MNKEPKRNELKEYDRQEAIAKISFALMQNGVDESDCKELAGVALNALLGGDKNDKN